jgi:nicotinamide-nucleotide amidase
MKIKMLGVSEITLQEHGAVSEAVVMEMANGALARSSADFAIAVSGIAGPDGGTADKPVGTVWLAWGGVDTLQARQLYFPRERKLFQLMVAATALDLIRRALLAIPQPPRYLAERTLRASSLA